MTKPNPLAHEPFSYRQTKNGVVHISSSGRVVKILKGNQAFAFLSKVQGASSREMQLQMAKVTGQFKFGNEKEIKGSAKG